MREENNDYFKNALSDFAYDMACGAQIRHLTDLGHTVSQIMEELDISVPYQRVQKTVNEHLQKTGVLTAAKPDAILPTKATFVREYDKYGRASFRKVVTDKGQAPAVHWQEHVYEPAADGKLLDFLTVKTEANGENASYISCDFGIERQKMEESMKVLKRRHQEYIQGILWEKARMYHRLTPCMREIAACLYQEGLYEGEAYFTATGEHILFCRFHRGYM